MNFFGLSDLMVLMKNFFFAKGYGKKHLRGSAGIGLIYFGRTGKCPELLTACCEAL
ncbi:MAG: hypothetical protein WCP19_14800 [Chloroflexota bacterium]